MAFYRNKKKLELSPRLKFGVGRGVSGNQILKIMSILFLVLAIGLSINAVRLIFTGSSKVNESGQQVLGASDENNGELRKVQFIEYQVVEKDTLFNISQKYNINWTTLATLNNLKAPFSLKPGQIIKIPK